MSEKKQTFEPDGTLATKIASEKIKIRELDLSQRGIFASALEALDKNRHLAKELDPTYEYEKSLIIAWLKAVSPANISPNTNALPSLNVKHKIALLNEEKIFSDTHHSNEIIKTYLSLVLQNSFEAKDITVYQSFNDNLVFKLNFETQKGEEIVYRDKELDLPVYMLAKLNLLVKITDPFAFVKFIDINLRQISVELILSKITPVISSALRAAALEAIEKKEICYYDLTKHYAEIAKVLENKLQEYFAGGGMTVSDTYIQYTRILNGADEIFENQRIEFMQKEKSLDLQHKAELMSLESYEKKAAIHNKYPSYEVGLTEREKDNAIDRYLIKQQGYRDEKIKGSKKTSLSERDNNINVNRVQDVYADKLEFKQNNYEKETLAIVIAILVAIIGIAVGSTALTFVLLGIAVLTIGLAIANIYNKKKIAQSVPSTAIIKEDISLTEENKDHDPQE